MTETEAKAIADVTTTAAAKLAAQGETTVAGTIQHPTLIYAALGFVVIMAVITALGLLWTKPAARNFEEMKLRFAAVTFTGILTLFVFAAVVFVASGEKGPGSVIFDRGLTAMFTLAGTVVGYLFGSAGRADASPPP